MDIAELESQNLEQLRDLAREADIAGFSRLKKQDLILRLLRDKAEKQGHKLRGGILWVLSLTTTSDQRAAAAQDFAQIAEEFTLF